MRVETGRDQHELGRERVERGQDARGPGGPELGRAGARRQRRVDDVAAPGFAGRAGAGIEGILVRGSEEDIRVGGEDGLGAVAVVDVEIDDGDTPQPVLVSRVRGADGDVVEQAKAHGAARFGVVAGRAHRAERVLGLARRHRADGGDNRAGRAQRRLARARRNHRVGIEPRVPGGGHGVENPAHVFVAMDPAERVRFGARRRAALECREIRPVEDRVNGAQALGALGMAEGPVSWPRQASCV